MDMLTGKAYRDFNKKYWYAILLPKTLCNLLAYRWFNAYTSVWIDVHNSDGKFDWAAGKHYSWNVFISNRTANNKYKHFDVALAQGLTKANELYNL